MHTAYIALGSNLGNRITNLKAAVAAFTPQMTVVAKSHIYETPPWGYTEQSAFLNQAVKVETYMEPEPLLRHLKRLEVALGREPGFQNGPRLIDLDLLFYDDLVLETPGLTVPHPRVHERAFVLVPLNDIAPEFVHPGLKKTVRELLTGCNTTGIQLVK